MDYELIKIIITVLCSAGGLFWTINKISIALINRNIPKEVDYEMAENGAVKFHSKGLTEAEITNVCKQLPLKAITEKPALQLVKPKKD